MECVYQVDQYQQLLLSFLPFLLSLSHIIGKAETPEQLRNEKAKNNANDCSLIPDGQWFLMVTNVRFLNQNHQPSIRGRPSATAKNSCTMNTAHTTTKVIIKYDRVADQKHGSVTRLVGRFGLQ